VLKKDLDQRYENKNNIKKLFEDGGDHMEQYGLEVEFIQLLKQRPFKKLSAFWHDVFAPTVNPKGCAVKFGQKASEQPHETTQGNKPEGKSKLLDELYLHCLDRTNIK
jgi:hypothetical protein